MTKPFNITTHKKSTTNLPPSDAFHHIPHGSMCESLGINSRCRCLLTKYL